MCFKTLGEYCDALHADSLHSKDKDSYPVPQIENMIRKRCEYQNDVATTQRWNEEIAETADVEDILCVNRVKHRNPLTVRSLVEYEQHRVVSYDYVAPKVVLTQQMDEEVASGSGHGSGGRRGRRGAGTGSGLTARGPLAAK